jgi:L-rhamnose mutarotase
MHFRKKEKNLETYSIYLGAKVNYVFTFVRYSTKEMLHVAKEDILPCYHNFGGVTSADLV